ncbi:hypothetical protein E2I00_002271 [Balaenoptera physalus]|uniref:Uncharacterized protein n=1 Tax=Balaenoptera physalus TaxID=9770 RepID=A0A6A1Q7Q7_BALPH|nr:hypothetical protein E2I00_002271 [Balaenoptera physalus]
MAPKQKKQLLLDKKAAVPWMTPAPSQKAAFIVA